MVGLADEGESDDNNTLSSYVVSIHLHGEKSPELKALLGGVSTAVADVKSPPPTVALLKAIAKSDISKMAKVLQSYSFYAGTVKIYFKEKEDPLRLIFSVTTGKPFLLNEITIDISGPGLPADIIPPNIKETGLKQGARGTALSIIDGGDNLLVNLRKLGYPFAEMADRKVVVDYATQMIDVTFTLSPGERAVFGKTTITGLEDVDEEFVRSKIPWKEGWYYDPNLIQKFRNRVSRA
ncbi:MAG TPA: hypothetical protein ENH12_07805, partial [Proteobacteria bacterium]|nr:hypothetical protein [Pseudomonadota bacterium]